MNTPQPPAGLPPLPAGTYYAGTLADHEGDIEGYAWHPGMIDKWNHGDSEPCKWKGMAMFPGVSSGRWHVALPIPATEPPEGMNHFCPGESGQGEWSHRSTEIPSICHYCKEPNEPSPPPGDAHVACADVSEPAQTNNNACPAGLAKLDDHGRGGFRIEAGQFWEAKHGGRVGPMVPTGSTYFPWMGEVTGGKYHGSTDSYTEAGQYYTHGPSDMDLVAPWIDWKAECEKLAKLSQDLCDLLNENIPSRLDEIEWESIRALESHLATLKGEGGRA